MKSFVKINFPSPTSAPLAPQVPGALRGAASGRGPGRGRGLHKNFIAAAFLCTRPLFLSAKEPGAAFLMVDSSVRLVALGGVATAAEGAQALGSNPALLPPLHGKSELYASFNQLWGDTTDGHVAFASALNSKQSWGLSATFLDAGTTPGRDELGQPTGGNTATHHETGTGAFSWEFWRGLRAGISGNLYQSTLARERSGASWAVDTGVSLHRKKILYSLSLNHLGPGIKYVDQRDPLPSVLQLDASWELGATTVLAGYHRSLVGPDAQGALGFEYRLRALSLRAGLHTRLGGPSDLAFENQSTTNQLLDNLTTGLGLQLGKSLRMDYAFKQSAPDWGPAHSLALTWTWGESPRATSPSKTVAKLRQTSPKPSDKKNPPPSHKKLGK